MRTVARNFILVTASRLIEGGVRFLTVPIVLGYFGREDFGLMALAFSLHVFLTLADFSISANVVRRFSDHLVAGDTGAVLRLARVATSVYVGIGLLNLAVVLLVGVFAERWFKLEPAQAQAFFWMMLSLGVSSLLTWAGTVYRQVLHASQQVGLDEAYNLLATVGTLLVLGATLWWRLDLVTYFALVLVPPLLPMWLRARRACRLVPGLGFGLSSEWALFSPLLGGTLWLLLMTLADMAANHFRPILLARADGLETVTDFRVMQQVAGFATLMLTGAMNVAYPAVARLDAAADHARLRLVLQQGSRVLLAGHVAVLVPLAFGSALLLELYVGAAYRALALPLALWLLSLLALHYTIVMSFAMSRGQTRLLALGACTNALVSLALAFGLAPRLGLQAMVASYAAYVVLQMLLMYLLALPAAGGGPGATLAMQVMTRPLGLALGVGLPVGAGLWAAGQPLWWGAPLFLAAFAGLMWGPGGLRADFRALRGRAA
jgi:O-antigen/teichoic acid export membrane protein